MPPTLPLHFYAFLAVNGLMDGARLRGQLEEFARLGLDGVVFHPRYYPGRPPYLSDDYLKILSGTILDAKALGRRFWIYDENGWPSGTADGGIYKNHPGDTCQRLDMVKEASDQTLTSFTDKGQAWHLTVQEVRGIDCFNPDAAQHFLTAIHERYRQGLSAEAFDHVEAFFTDEPESGVSWEPAPLRAAVPWSRRMPEFLQERFGRDVTAQLPLLFVEGEGSREFREAYWELVTDLFCRGFLDPYREWCERHGKLFVGHVKGEEHPLFQVPMVGSCQRAYRHFSMPGVDALERYPTNHFYPRQASSVARQFGNGRCLVEANGGSGWGTGPEDLQRYLVWLGRQGLTDFVLHLSQYQLDSPALYDWPPSQPLHVSWREAYPEILKNVRREVGNAAHAPRDTLVVAPYRAIMGAYEPWELWQTNIHDGSNYPMTRAGRLNSEFIKLIEYFHARRVAYDITDERTFEESASLSVGAILLGQGRYRSIVVSPGAVLNEKARMIVEHALPPDPTATQSSSASQMGASPSVDLRWSAMTVTENAFLLEPVATEKDAYAAQFTTPDFLPAGCKIAMAFVDRVKDVVMNGRVLAVESNPNGAVATIPIAALRSVNEVTFHIPGSSCVPFVWLTGDFLVRSASPYAAGPNSTLRTDGPLKIVPLTNLSAVGELVQAGLPYAFKSVEARATVSISIPARKLKFQFALARPDALLVSDTSGELGWIWGPEWTLQLEEPLPSGVHELRVQCIPNSYNYYGPHHHYLGDRHVVSPDQIRGVRNFADPADAPAKTHVSAWHFRPWSLPSRVQFLG